MKKSNKKTLVLSVVAFVLILMSLVSFTYSWIDDIKLVEFQNADVADGAPLKAGTDINATVKITKTENEINLGNMIKPSDITIQNYEYDEGYTAPHATYPRNEEEATKQQEFIDKNKGYFYESGDMHLSPCYSDGETFYFERKGDSGYREGNKDDENVNYISFTAKVSSPDANVDFWFESLPSIQGFDESGNAVDVSANARYSLTVDGECHVYSPSGEAQTCNADMTDTTDVIGTRQTSVYTYGNTDNTTEARGQNSNTLFSIKRGNTVYLTVKIWLEDGGDLSSVVTSNINLNLVSSWAYKRDITIVDYTSSCKYISSTDSSSDSSWLGDQPLYFTLPDVLDEMGSKMSPARDVLSWDKIPNAPFYNVKVESDNVKIGTTDDGHKYFKVKNIPLVYNNERMMLFRENDGWYTGNYTTSKDNYKVLCYNWWSTYLPNTYTNDVYRIYGGSHDNYAKRYFPSTVDNKCETFQGYGTWGNLIKIQVDGRTKAISTSNDDSNVKEEVYSDNIAYKGSNSSEDLYICDYSDKATTGEVYVHGMSYEQSEECWFAYVPESSSLLQFYYHKSDTEKGYFGYNSWDGDNPQQRPKSVTKYFLTHRMKHSGKYDGIGYWQGEDKIYLLKNGNIGTADNVHAYMYRCVGDDHYDYNSGGAPGLTMEATGDYDPRSPETPIYYVSSIDTANEHQVDREDNNPGYYHFVTFAGKWDDNTSQPKYGRQVPMCPGCYFDWQANKWLGSLTGSGRSDAVDDGSGGGGDSGGQESGGGENTGTPTAITNSEPTTEGLYAYGKLQKTDASYVQYAQFSSDSTGGNIVIYLEQGQDYQFMLRKGKKDNWTRYATLESNSGPTLSSTGTPAEWSLSNNNSQKIKLNVLNTGYYTISIKSSDSGSYNLQFTYN